MPEISGRETEQQEQRKIKQPSNRNWETKLAFKGKPTQRNYMRHIKAFQKQMGPNGGFVQDDIDDYFTSLMERD